MVFFGFRVCWIANMREKYKRRIVCQGLVSHIVARILAIEGLASVATYWDWVFLYTTQGLHAGIKEPASFSFENITFEISPVGFNRNIGSNWMSEVLIIHANHRFYNTKLWHLSALHFQYKNISDRSICVSRCLKYITLGPTIRHLRKIWLCVYVSNLACLSAMYSSM